MIFAKLQLAWEHMQGHEETYAYVNPDAVRSVIEFPPSQRPRGFPVGTVSVETGDTDESILCVAGPLKAVIDELRRAHVAKQYR